MRTTVAILGPGAVGGTFAVRFMSADYRTICVARETTVRLMALAGISFEANGSTPLVVRPEVAERVSTPLSLLLVSVKPDQLEDAIARVDPEAVAEGVVVPLLDGLEHMAVLRERFPGRVAAAALWDFDGYRVGRMQIVQPTPQLLVSLAADEMPEADLERAARLLERAGVEVEREQDERRVLWRRLVRMAGLAPATALTQRTVGDLRTDHEWRPRLEQAVAEACAVAAADGVHLMPSAQWTRIIELKHDSTTSVARAENGHRATEIDAITGAVLRAAERHGVECPVLSELAARTAYL
jgi:2-dehydropantoate 2-reductase